MILLFVKIKMYSILIKQVMRIMNLELRSFNWWLMYMTVFY